jgi:hypothetical protein
MTPSRFSMPWWVRAITVTGVLVALLGQLILLDVRSARQSLTEELSSLIGDLVETAGLRESIDRRMEFRGFGLNDDWWPVVKFDLDLPVPEDKPQMVCQSRWRVGLFKGDSKGTISWNSTSGNAPATAANP